MCNISYGVYLPTEITSSTSFNVISIPFTSLLFLLYKDNPYASVNIFTAFLPSIVYLLINSATPFSKLTSSFFAALLTISSISVADNGSKNTSVHLDLNAGLISFGSLVVAPIKTKSAGAPLSNKYFIYFGVLSSSGS